MTPERISEQRPYLKDIDELYQKVMEFDGVELEKDYSGLAQSANHYVGEDVDKVVEEFSRIFSLPPETSASIKEALRSGAMDFTALAHGDTDSLERFAEGETREELYSFLYILSRPFFRSIKRSLNVDDIYWEEGRCPVCNSFPALSIIEKNDARRYYCSFCGTMGRYRRMGCPHCGSEKPEERDIMYSEREKGVRLDACKACGGYVKTVEAEGLAGRSMEEMDLITLPFDIVAQEKGFHRRCPNPVGIIKVT